MTVDTMAVGPAANPGGGASSFRDSQSESIFHVGTVDSRPDLWAGYLDGALRAYRHYGVERALDIEHTREGGTTSLFFTAVDAAGDVVAGVRMQGPYLELGEVDSLRPWADRHGGAYLRRVVEERIRLGMVEARGAWVARDHPHRRALAAAVSRCIAHGPLLFGVPYGFCTVASFTLDRHRAAGGVAMAEVPAVAYPDERYRTVPVLWDAQSYRAYATAAQYALLRAEWRELGLQYDEYDPFEVGGRS
ncbi:hypothetical protein [Nocardia sp. alder85J]|uniref:hypothetical protein n=1 Tax=Nocardia sp. alder85J TaxID=2862949 RepID=UPI001CD2535F|nr:hypothetical protein [Nocardia sp. alder85J]MCX4097148.1 hypothetical protein [Nocardia sp. alder85J]